MAQREPMKSNYNGETNIMKRGTKNVMVISGIFMLALFAICGSLRVKNQINRLIDVQLAAGIPLVK